LLEGAEFPLINLDVFGAGATIIDGGEKIGPPLEFVTFSPLECLLFDK
jgi:hypothetical protein